MAQSDVHRAPHLREDPADAVHDPAAASSNTNPAASAQGGLVPPWTRTASEASPRIPSTPVAPQHADHERLPVTVAGAGMRTPRGPDMRPRERRVMVDSTTQAEALPSTDWRQFDSNRAIRQLSSPNDRIRTLTLRRLHVR
eukprot:4148725-Amphidinium_carterae.1